MLHTHTSMQIGKKVHVMCTVIAPKELKADNLQTKILCFWFLLFMEHNFSWI